MNDDATLLRQFVDDHSDAAFRELVRQRLDFVYAAALRQVGGDAHLAQDISQSVFLDLARKARSLAGRPSITGWLYTSTRFAAAKARRSRQRRAQREQEAHAMEEISSAPKSHEANWDELRPVLDAAMHELAEADRDAILLRFFEGRSFAEVGIAVGTTENTARMRVDRALDKLRARLARRGITSTAAALGVAIAQQPAVAAPAGLAASIAGASLAGATVASTTGLAAAVTAIEFMSMTKITVGAVAALAVLGVGAYVATQHGATRAELKTPESLVTQTTEISELREQVRQLKAENDRLAAAAAAHADASTRATAATGEAAGTEDTLQRLRLLADLRKQGLVTARLPFADFMGNRLNKNFFELFGLTSDEIEAANKAWAKAQKQIGDLTVANAKTHVTPDGKLVISVPPFEGGAAVYDTIMDDMTKILGPERGEAFVALEADEVADQLSRFGAENRTITLTPHTTGDNKFKVEDQRSYPRTSAPTSTSTGASAPRTGVPISIQQSSGSQATSDVARRGGASGGSRIVSTTIANAGEFASRFGDIAKVVPPGYLPEK